MAFDKTGFNCRDPMTITINVHINNMLDSWFALVMTGPISTQHAIPIGSVLHTIHLFWARGPPKVLSSSLTLNIGSFYHGSNRIILTVLLKTEE